MIESVLPTLALILEPSRIPCTLKGFALSRYTEHALFLPSVGPMVEAYRSNGYHLSHILKMVFNFFSHNSHNFSTLCSIANGINVTRESFILAPLFLLFSF